MTLDRAAADPAHRRAAQAAAFDRIGIRYDEAFPHKAGQRHLVNALLARLPAPARVLDVGCGTGLPTARQLAAAGCEVTGLDISPVMIDIASRNVPQASFRRGDVTELDDRLGRFDGVVAFFSLLMLTRAEIVRTLARLRTALRPAGWLALSMVEADLDDAEFPFLGQSVRVTGWPRADLRAVVEQAGFTIAIEDIRRYSPPTRVAPPEVQIFLLASRSDRPPDRRERRGQAPAAARSSRAPRSGPGRRVQLADHVL